MSDGTAEQVDAETLRDRARDWLAQDPDPATRSELEQLLADADDAAIADRFASRLQFGTAGLRGALGAGPNRMNRVIVAQAAAGLANYLLANRSRETGQTGDPDHGAPSLVIGYDARYNSDVFARDTAEIAQGLGVRALLLPTALPTPVLAFAIHHLGCSAGVMVTASHNPPQDNGYKVYLADSSQIVPPADGQISAAIDAVGNIAEVPRSSDYTDLGPEVAQAYCQAVADLSKVLRAPGDSAGTDPAELIAVYTPMHGVGLSMVKSVTELAGFAPLRVVAEQAEPNPDFPTVAFPNPEEPGAMDLALGLADAEQADLVLANDPDADRCAVGVRTGGPDARTVMLTGDQTGALLADIMLRRGVKGIYGSSIVSSDLLGLQAAAYGQPWQQTLTGFKWLGKIEGLVFGYEEALGYSVAPHIARDKDGVSAVLAVLELAAELKAQGRTLLDRLDDIYREYGLHLSDQLSVRVDDLSIISRAMAALRTSAPTTLGGLPVATVDDLETGYRDLPPTDGIRLGLAATNAITGARVICRPSGTEPKLKCYVEVVVAVGDDIDAARNLARQTVDAMKADLARALGLA